MIPFEPGWLGRVVSRQSALRRRDLVEVEGRIVTGGSKVWATRRANRTATLARRLIGAGIIIIGKTHTVEFALGGWGTNEHMGTPHNRSDDCGTR
jgi:aspartyl-tRNA(Asn)/glutamyl-tRNA(Gln) amidotransferase subunit A